MIDDLEQRQFLELGLRFLITDVCPLCDTTWEADALRRLVTEKLARIGKGAELV